MINFKKKLIFNTLFFKTIKINVFGLNSYKERKKNVLKTWKKKLICFSRWIWWISCL